MESHKMRTFSYSYIGQFIFQIKKKTMISSNGLKRKSLLSDNNNTIITTTTTTKRFRGTAYDG
jgi:hypothetical protein